MWKFKRALWIPNHNPLSQTLNTISFYLSLFPVKINGKVFKIKKKPCFVVIFAQREFFLKTSAKYNYSGWQAFKYQKYRLDWQPKQKLFHHWEHANIIQSVCSIYQIICEIHHDHAHPVIIKVTLVFLNLYQHAKN